MISRAVVHEFYETGIEAPILRNWTASSDSRCASTAVVKEIHVALDDGEGCVVAGAVVEKIRYPEVLVLIVASPAVLPSKKFVLPLLMMVALPAVAVPPPKKLGEKLSSPVPSRIVMVA